MRVVIPTLVSNYRIGDNFISFFFCLNWQLDAYSSDSTANHLAVFDYIEPAKLCQFVISRPANYVLFQMLLFSLYAKYFCVFC